MTIESATIDLEEDDIFARPPRAVARQHAKTARITCRVCAAQATVGLAHPALLCPLCLEDLDATRDRHAAQLQAALAGLEVNQQAWDALRLASPALGRWGAVQGAMIGVAEKRVDRKTFDLAWAKRKQEGGPLAALLIAYETYARECDRLGAELSRLASAQTEINAAWLATEV